MQTNNKAYCTKEMVLIVLQRNPEGLTRRICRKGVCANITAYFRGSTSQIDSILRRDPPVLLRKRGM
jgi:hypothetical protein